MNLRIRELVKQAGFFPDRNWDHTNWHAAGHNDTFEKLAELIVAEMLQTCEDHPAWTARMIGEHVKQHFGVEK